MVSAIAGAIRDHVAPCSFVLRGPRLSRLGFEHVNVFISGQRRGVKTAQLKRELIRRSAIEPSIGHMKTDGSLNRCWLKGAWGAEAFASLTEARVIIEQWRVQYNTIRPHSSLGYRPPAPEAHYPKDINDIQKAA